MKFDVISGSETHKTGYSIGLHEAIPKIARYVHHMQQWDQEYT